MRLINNNLGITHAFLIYPFNLIELLSQRKLKIKLRQSFDVDFLQADGCFCYVSILSKLRLIIFRHIHYFLEAIHY